MTSVKAVSRLPRPADNNSLTCTDLVSEGGLEHGNWCDFPGSGDSHRLRYTVSARPAGITGHRPPLPARLRAGSGFSWSCHSV